MMNQAGRKSQMRGISAFRWKVEVPLLAVMLSVGALHAASALLTSLAAPESVAAQVRGGTAALRLSSELGGANTTAVQLDGDTAYASIGPRLTILDFANPAGPKLLGEVRLPAPALALAKNSHVVYAATDRAGLQVIDVTDVVHPKLIAPVVVDFAARDVIVAAGHAYVVSSTGVDMLDVADPLRIHRVAQIPFRGASSVGADGRYLYITGRGELTVMDLTDPSAPQFVGRLRLDTNTDDALVTDLALDPERSLAFVAVRGMGLWTVDVGNPEAMATLSLFDHKNLVHLAVGESGVFATDGQRALWFDLSDPRLPRLLGNLSSPTERFLSIDVVGSNVALGMTSEVVVWRHTRDDDQEFARYKPQVTSVRDVAVSGNMAWVISNGKLLTLDLSDPADPRVVAEIEVSPWSQGIELDGDQLILDAGRVGVSVFDITDPARPRNIGSHSTSPAGSTTPAGDVAVADGRIYVAIADELLVLQRAPSGELESAGQSRILPPVGSGARIAASDELVYAATSNGLWVIDAADPAAMQRIGNAAPGSSYAVEVDDTGSVAWLSQDGLQTYDVTDPSRPVYLGASDSVGLIRDIDAQGGAAVTAEGEAVGLYDVSQPRAPRRIAWNSPHGEAERVSISGRLVAAALREGGLAVFEIIDLPETVFLPIAKRHPARGG